MYDIYIYIYMKIKTKQNKTQASSMRIFARLFLFSFSFCFCTYLFLYLFFSGYVPYIKKRTSCCLVTTLLIIINLFFILFYTWYSRNKNPFNFSTSTSSPFTPHPGIALSSRRPFCRELVLLILPPPSSIAAASRLSGDWTGGVSKPGSEDLEIITCRLPNESTTDSCTKSQVITLV